MKYVVFILPFLLCSCLPSQQASINPSDELKVGRYEVKQISEYRRDQYLIDTATGRIWTRVCEGDISKEGICSSSIWQEERVENKP